MANEIIVTQASPEDAHGITLVRRTTWLTTYPNEQEGITKEDIEASHNRRTIDEESTRRADRIEHSTDSRIWVAKDNDAVIGFVEVQKTDERNRVRAFYILSDYQKQGIGSALMKKALDWLGNDKLISCEVVTYNKQAIGFYKKFGFVENGSTTNDVAALPSGKVIPEIEMVRNPQ